MNRQDGKTMVTKEILLTNGFNFTFHTHTYTTQKGSTYYYCYEQGYLFLEDRNVFLLVTNKDKEN